MKLKLSSKNPRIAVDELGNEILKFTGLHWDDWRWIIAKINARRDGTFSKRSVEI